MTDSSSHSLPHSADPSEPDPDFIKWLKENAAPIVFTIFAALLLCLVAHTTSIDGTKTKDFTNAFANVTQALAFIAGGVWAYFKFAKGRTFRERLSPTVSGRVVAIDGAVFLVVTIQLKNTGLSRITFDQKTSSLIVFECVRFEEGEILSVVTNRLTTFQVFGESDRYIESNEIVVHQHLIALPYVPSIWFQIEFKVVSESKNAWRATAVVTNSTFDDNEAD